MSTDRQGRPGRLTICQRQVIYRRSPSGTVDWSIPARAGNPPPRLYLRLILMNLLLRSSQKPTRHRASTENSLTFMFVSDIAVFVLKRDVKLQLTN